MAHAQPEPGETSTPHPDHHHEDDSQVAERIARARGVRGKYAYVATSSDAFLRAKRQEIAREDRRS